MNIGFGIAVVVAVVILVVVAGVSYYGEHLAPGRDRRRPDDHEATSSTTRATVESLRLQQQATRIKAEVAAGPADERPGASRRSSQLQQPGPDAAARLDRPREADRRARSRRSSPRRRASRSPPEQIDARIVEEIDDAGGAPRLADRGRAGGRHRRDRSDRRPEGRREEEGRRRPRRDQGRRQDVGGRRQGGLDRRDGRRPAATSAGSTRPRPRIPAWLDAVFALDANGLTDVIEGDDGDVPDRPGHRDRAGRGRPGLARSSADAKV